NPHNLQESSIVPIPEISHSVFSILEDNSKNIWIGTYGGGIYRWLVEPSTGTYEKDLMRYDPANPNSISSNIIRNIYEDSHRNIWFATGNGLCKLSSQERIKAKPKFEVYKNIPGDTSSISHNYILTIYESKAGDLWVGTFGGGLNKLVPSFRDQPERFVSYSKTDGLPNNVIKGILEDEEGTLWLSTNQGLSRFDPKNEVLKNYDVNDGLQSNEFQELACLKRQSGEMLFGGINGFNAFFPENITDNSFEAETVITDFLVSNNPVQIGEVVNGRAILRESINTTNEIDLKYRENSFSFEFAALHYAAPQKNLFAYKLEGFDKDWVFTSSKKRFATYTNLAPGNYSLKVKASNNDGIWDTSPSEIKIKVTPPLWRTNGAYVFYSLLFVGLLLAFRRYTVIRTTEKHQLVLEHLEKERHEEMQRIKLDFFTNISHEFRTPLTLIKGPLEYLQKQGDKLDEQTVHEQYGLMHKNTDYLLRLVNQLLDFRKLDQGKMKLVVRLGNIVEFFKEVGEPFQFLAHKKRIKYKVKAPNKLLQSWFDPDALEKIINNLLSNAFKFTPEHGSVTVEIDSGSDFQMPKKLKNRSNLSNYVIISIVDSGPGIPPSKIEHIFEKFYIERDKKERNSQGAGIGLAFTKNLVELHKGTIDAISKNNKGATFIVMLPMIKEAYLETPEISLQEGPAIQDYVHPSNADSHTIDLNDEIVDQDFSRTRSKLPLLLVVDDNNDIRAFVKQGLKDRYTICEAEDGKQGLNMANKLMPNIILSDILMPVMDGLEFCEKIKTNKETSHIPVVMLTAKSSQASEIEGTKSGADDYIRKPFDLELLRLKLANIISHREELRKRFNREVTLQPKEVTVTSADETFLHQAIEIVEEQMMNTDFSVEMLVREMGLSRSNLYLKFKELTGLSSSEFIRSIRLKRAVQLLENSDLSVKEIMYMTGFNTASYFSKCFKKQFGMIPSEYVRQAQDAGGVA
ncbi:MAG: hybrid sensor histidine kinase/response regulator transcription factor, partial [Aurantibacter sp.]